MPPRTRRVRRCDVETRVLVRVGGLVLASWRPCGRRASKLVALEDRPIASCRRCEVLLATGLPLTEAALALALSSGPPPAPREAPAPIVDPETTLAAERAKRREDVMARAKAAREAKERRKAAVRREVAR